MARIGKREILSLLAKAVEEKGEDHVVPAGQCIYFEDRYDAEQDTNVINKTKPSCLVGYVAYLSGNQGFIDLLAHEDNNSMGLGGVSTDSFLTDGAKTVLQKAQRVQDDQGTWGAALAAAKEVA